MHNSVPERFLRGVRSQRKATQLKVEHYIASTGREENAHGFRSREGGSSHSSPLPTPVGTLHGVVPGAVETLCGYPIVALHTFEEVIWKEDSPASCERCVAALRFPLRGA